jgi:aminopeptidase N
MIQTLIGRQLCRRGMDLYFERHDGEAATVEQFVQCFADASGRDFSQFMRWYSQAGTPEVVASGYYDAGTRSYRLDLAQTVPPTPGQSDKEPMVIPLIAGLLASDGRELPLNVGGRPVERGLVVLDRAAQSFLFENVSERPVLSINRGFSAPIRLTANLGPDDQRLIAARDGDPFNRWQAVQTLATTLLAGNVARLRAGHDPEADEGLLDALAAILSDQQLEPAFIAEALIPPSESDIAREIGRDVDPDAIFRARAGLRTLIGLHLNAALTAAYDSLAPTGPYSPDATSAGRRMLRNVCLDLLAATQERHAIKLAERQYQTADNMTDRMAALGTLSLHAVPERVAAFDDFYQRYRDDPLIIDKWLALQAMTPDPATLDRVRALIGHPAFSMTNPNRVRSLIGAFAQSNPTQFNRPDGAGFEFVVDRILELDPANPQVAARMTTAFRSWRALEPTRRARAQAALQRIAAAPKLSRDVGDIAERALADA